MRHPFPMLQGAEARKAKARACRGAPGLSCPSPATFLPGAALLGLCVGVWKVWPKRSKSLAQANISSEKNILQTLKNERLLK